MEVGNVMEVWDDVETEAESEGSDESEQEDMVTQEFGDDSSEEEDISMALAAPSTAGSSRPAYSRGSNVYNWEEISDGKEKE